MLIKDGSEIGMEWAILDGSGWQAVFKSWEVIGVTDIVCESYPEAVNIVIRTPDEVYGRMDNCPRQSSRVVRQLAKCCGRSCGKDGQPGTCHLLEQ